MKRYFSSGGAGRLMAVLFLPWLAVVRVEAAEVERVAPADQPPPPFDFSAADGGGVRGEPRRLKAAEHGVGRRVVDAVLGVAGGESAALSTLAGERGTVVCLMSPTCPVTRRQLPEWARLSASYAAEGFGFVYLEVGEPLDEGALRGAGLVGVVARDDGGRLRSALKVSSSTEVFVLDAARTLVYRGAMDDRHGVGWSRERARFRYLVDALEAVKEGRGVEVAATTAPGCALEAVEGVVPVEPLVTFHNRISRVLQANCQRCHREGGLGPFPLETYDQVRAKAGMIRRMVEEDLMPPWFAAPAAGQPTPWANDSSLAGEDKAALLTWLGGERLEGDPADAPRPRRWPSDWSIGTPDAIFQTPQPIAVKAEGVMEYQNVLVETGLTEDRWVTAWEVAPSALAVVHHVLIWVRDPAERAAGRKPDEDESGFFAAYVPGHNAAVYAAGLAKKLPAGAVLRVQIHYTPNGTAVEDRIRLGVRFAAEPPRHVVEVATLAQPRLRIPAGVSFHAETAAVVLPKEVRVLGFFPHMHLRGRAFRYEVVLPDGPVRTLLQVPRYDFNWQLSYQLNEPLALAAGTRLRATGWFDNSADNPHNPDPTSVVSWGPQTFEEMMIGYVEYYEPSQPVPRDASSR